MIKFEGNASLAYHMLDSLTDNKHVAAIGYIEDIKYALFYFLAEDVDMYSIQIDYEYDKEYIVELTKEDDCILGCVGPAYSYSCGSYVSPAANYILIDVDVPNKCLTDIISNPYGCTNPEFHRYYVEEPDDECNDDCKDEYYENETYDDCETCPERFECPYAEPVDDEELSVATDGITVIKNTDGTIRGFTKMKSFTDENNVHSSSSHSFFSDDIDTIRAAAKVLGIEL